jgi:hypothetical protein
MMWREAYTFAQSAMLNILAHPMPVRQTLSQPGCHAVQTSLRSGQASGPRSSCLSSAPRCAGDG